MIRRLWHRVATWIRPDKAEISPLISFDEASGILSAVLNLTVHDRPVLVNRSILLRGRGRKGERLFRLSAEQARLVRSLAPMAERITASGIEFKGDRVPRALELLRGFPRTVESQTAKAVTVHSSNLKPHTYIELEDPETLVVREHLATIDGRVITPNEAGVESTGEWIRERSDFFPAPTTGPKPVIRGNAVAPGTHRLRSDEIPDFIVNDLPDIYKKSRVLADPGAKELRVVEAAPELATKIDLKEGDGQLIVQPQYRSGSVSLPHHEVRRLPREQRYFRRGPVFHRTDHELTERVEKALKDIGLTEQEDGTYVAPSLHIDEIINTFSRLGILAETEIFQRFRERLLGFVAIEREPLPGALRQGFSVRDYQRGGYDWLVFLKRYGLPGVLADEMGLGKTLQTLLAVAHFKERFGPCPSLVVCPAALVEKWADESEKFLSAFTALSHAGTGRAERLRRYIGTADIVISSYDTLTRDAEFLAQWRWRFLIADEAQKVKNPGTQRARAIRRIPAEARIAITGTPVENRLLDLWSIFDFLAPGYLGSSREFERRFADPIEKRRSEPARQALVGRTKPFVMRRLKKAVAHELPDKIMKPLRCELTVTQRALYHAVLERDLEKAIMAVGSAPLSLGNPHIFAVLTKLKQICCHPGLITKEFRPFELGVSGKFDVFAEVLDGILESQAGENPNKLVGFSQYVGMAGYLHDYIAARGQTCDLLDGRVPPGERPDLCRRFNESPQRFGMMLTLGAGGVGLDLQSANYVVMYDRWWNPAVEDQAIDRVHRLGQARAVVVITITTRGTLEERIQAKLEAKRNLSDQVIQADALMRKEITRGELLDLVRLEDAR